jgi:uncharacterized membrane protein
MNETAVYLSVAGGVIVVLGFLGTLVAFLFKLGGKMAVHEKTLTDVVADTTAAHDKIRTLSPVVAEHETSIQLVQKDVSYIREGIDDIKTAMRSRA